MDPTYDAPAVLVTTTHDDERAAQALARSAVEARVAACAQVGSPVRSFYWWEGRVEDATEWVVTFKTPASRWPALREHLLSAHSYDVPELIITPITDGLPAYLTWLAEETTPPA